MRLHAQHFFLKIPKISIFQRPILEKQLELSKKRVRKWVLELEVFKKMYLVKFRKLSKMGQNLKKWEALEKLLKKWWFQKYRVCSSPRNIFKMFGFKVKFSKNSKNFDICLSFNYIMNRNTCKLVDKDRNQLITKNCCKEYRVI